MGAVSCRVVAVLVALAWTACADYADIDVESTVFKCDAQNACPDNYFCDNEPSGICVLNGTLGCKGQELVRNWGFTTSEDGWIFDLAANSGITGHSIGWAPDEGSPNLGSLKLELFGTSTTVKRLGWFRPEADALGDLRGKWVSALARTDKPGMIMKVYVENNTTGLGWTDGGEFNLNANQWDCAGVRIDMPKYSAPGFDPTTVRRLGLELWGTLPATVIVDDVGY